MNGKNVIISGGANGIGFECAKLFCEKGYNVYVLDNDKKAIEKGQNYNIKFYECDISCDYEVTDIANLIVQEIDKIDIIINCAGIQIEESFYNYSKEKWQEVMNVNYFGTCNVISSFLKYMKKGATILNLISIHSFKPRINKYVYDSSKSALEMLTKELGLELASSNITINALSFGAVETKMNEIWKKNPTKKEEARNKVPLKIIFEPKQIATFAYEIITQFSLYTTGSIFVIDGGRSLK